MAAVTICSDFGAPKIKSDTVSTVSPSTCQSLSHVQLFATLWTVACQTPLSMGILQARILVAMPSSPAPWGLPKHYFSLLDFFLGFCFSAPLYLLSTQGWLFNLWDPEENEEWDLAGSGDVYLPFLWASCPREFDLGIRVPWVLKAGWPRRPCSGVHWTNWGRATTPPHMWDTMGTGLLDPDCPCAGTQARADQQWSLAIQHAGVGRLEGLWSQDLEKGRQSHSPKGGREANPTWAEAPGLLGLLHCPSGLHFQDKSVRNLRKTAAKP